MTAAKLIFLACAVLGVSGVATDTSVPDRTSVTAAKDPPICEITARAVFESAKLGARAQFWLDVGQCLNEGSSTLPTCMHDAFDDLRESLDLARDQLHARLDLCGELGPGRYDPSIVPSQFSSNVTNNYLPLPVGRTLIYEKQTSEGVERLTMTILNQTVEIAGVECRVVRAVETIDNELVEDTVDWFAQDTHGDVWYFGEISQNYEDGLLDNLDGSWRAGRDGAKPGTIMLACPTIGTFYRQEFALGEAEDVAEVISTDDVVTVPYGTFTNCLQTEDWTPIEPDNRERKFYAPGIGLVLEVDVANGERLELVQIMN